MRSDDADLGPLTAEIVEDGLVVRAGAAGDAFSVELKVGEGEQERVERPLRGGRELVDGAQEF